ncbi:Tkl protein kinase, partial [Globisporangium splendens]
MLRLLSHVAAAVVLQLVVTPLAPSSAAITASSLSSSSSYAADMSDADTVIASAGQCALFNTLTFSCQSQCATGRPCIQYPSLAACEKAVGGWGETKALSSCVAPTNSSNSCGIECFKTNASDADTVASDEVRLNGTTNTSLQSYSSFKFFIPFSPSNLAGRPVANATRGFPSKNEDVLQNVAALDLPNSTTSLVLAGGTNTTGVKGWVVQTKIANWLLPTKTSLRDVTFANINIKKFEEQMFPYTLVSLSITNCLLEKVPTDMAKFVTLERLNLTQNNLDAMESKLLNIKSLLTLDVSSNSFEAFDAAAPNLEYLNLELNSFNGLVLNQSEFDFLSGIETLRVDSFGPLACDASMQQSLSGVTVCVQGDSETSVTSTSKSNNAGLIGGISAALVVVVVIVGSVIWIRRRRVPEEDAMDYHAGLGTSSAKHSSLSSGNYTNLGSSRRSLWDDQELISLQVRYEDVEDIHRIGAGGFGVVWLARYRQTQLVASKRLKRDEVTWQRTQDFISEIKMVSKIDHPCIVPLIGVAWTIELDLQALFEYMVNGDLRSYLINNADDFRGVWTREKLKIMLNVAEALVYLHSFTPPLVHRDLKSGNVLLGEQMNAKLSDFGISRFQSEQGTMTAGVGTGKWLAPEVISGNNDYDQSCDVFSFGAVLAEMDTHELPYQNLRGPADNMLNEVAVLQMVAAGTLRPSFTPTCPPQILELAEKCLSFDPAQRPTAYQITYALRTIEASNDTKKHPPPPLCSTTFATMFMLKKKQPKVDTTKQMKAIVWDISKIAVIFVGIRAASVFLNKEN